MPLIRYRIGDLGRVENEPCACGLHSPRLFDIRGREADIIWRPDGSGISGTMLVASGMNALLFDTKVQIVQKKIDEITIRVEGDPADNPEGMEYMMRILNDVLGGVFKVNTESVKEIKRAPSGKYQYVVSEIKK